MSFPNWCNDEEIKPLGHSDNPLRQTWALQNKFVVGYSGNLGRAHDFGTVLAAAERLRDDPRILFLMIGGGKRFDELARTVKERRLDSLFRFVPYQERNCSSILWAPPTCTGYHFIRSSRASSFRASSTASPPRASPS